MRHVTADTLRSALTTWWAESAARGGVLEVSDSGCPTPLRDALPWLRDDIPDAVTVDATGRTAEEILATLCELCDLPEDPSQQIRLQRRAEPRLVVVLNAFRAGRTRSSAHPRRLTEDFFDRFAKRNKLGVVLDVRNLPLRSLPPRTRWSLVAADPSSESAADLADGSPSAPPAATPAEFTALALAETREVPWPVWAELCAAFGLDGSEEALRTLAAARSDLLRSSEDAVAFADETVAESLRAQADPSRADTPHQRLVQWLRQQANDFAHPDGWRSAGPVAAYAARALPGHALRGGVLSELLTDGLAMANVDPDALLDAASLLDEEIPAETPAADAFHLHLHGVRLEDQREWACFLHLMATARGDARLAREMRGSGLAFPWEVAWSDWRPPGGWQLRFHQPGSVVGLVELRWRGEPVIVGFCEHDDRILAWEPHTGARVFPPSYDEFPPEIAAELSWPDGRTTPMTARNLRLASVPSTDNDLASELFTVALPVGSLLLVGGPGGVAALRPGDADSDSPPEPAPSRDPERSWPYGEARLPLPTEARHPTVQALRELFGPDHVRTLAESALPEGLTDPTARQVLRHLGLPTAQVGGLHLSDVPETGPEEVPWPGSAPDPGSTGPFYRLGTMLGGDVLLDGRTGAVLRVAGADDPTDAKDHIHLATDLERLVGLTVFFTLGLLFLRSAWNDTEEWETRLHIRSGLAALDHYRVPSPAWTHGMFED